jgi:sarcosine oxidase subunit beta
LKYIRSWSGIIDFSPDDNFIMESPEEPSGLIFACGYSGHGFALTPMTGRLLAELALNGKTSFPTEPFSLKRFKEKGGNKQSHFAHQSLDETHA